MAYLSHRKIDKKIHPWHVQSAVPINVNGGAQLKNAQELSQTERVILSVLSTGDCTLGALTQSANDRRQDRKYTPGIIGQEVKKLQARYSVALRAGDQPDQFLISLTPGGKADHEHYQHNENKGRWDYRQQH